MPPSIIPVDSCRRAHQQHTDAGAKHAVIATITPTGFPAPTHLPAYMATATASAKFTSTNTPVPHDTTPPRCTLTGVGTNSAGKKYIQITVLDGESGLQAVTVTRSTNANTVVSAFTVGTTSAVLVTATKID